MKWVEIKLLNENYLSKEKLFEKMPFFTFDIAKKTKDVIVE